MIRSLFVREVRRQAVPALALIGLGTLLIAAYGLFASELGWRGINGFAIVPMILAALGPYLLGVAAVAPDVESGGEAFLIRLPLRRERLLLARALAAGAWSVLVVAAVTALDALVGRGSAPDEGLQLAGLATGAFLAGLVASITLRYTLLAFMCGPTLIGAPLLVYQFVLEEGLRLRWSDPVPFTAVALFGMALTAAWSYQRGDLVGPGWRALRLAAPVYLGLVVVGLGATEATWAVACAARREVALQGAAERADGSLTAASWVAAHPRIGLEWTGPPRERALLVQGGARLSELSLSRPLGFSPDGSRSLHAAYEAHGTRFTVLDEAGSAAFSLTLPFLVSPAPPPTLSGEVRSVGWAGQVPWVVVTEGRGGPTWAAEVAPGGRRVPVVGTARGFVGSRLLVHAQLPLDTRAGAMTLELHTVLDLDRPELGLREPVGAPASANEALLVGDALVGLIDGPAGARLVWTDLGREGSRGELALAGLPPPRPAPDQWSRGVEVWADGSDGLVVSAFGLDSGRTSSSRAWRVDLVSGQAVDLGPRLGDYVAHHQVGPGWLCARKQLEPAGAAWALVSTRVEPEATRELRLNARPSRLFSGERLLLEDGRVVDARSGAPLIDLLAPLR